MAKLQSSDWIPKDYPEPETPSKKRTKNIWFGIVAAWTLVFWAVGFSLFVYYMF